MKTSSSIAVINKINIPVKAIENYINTNINREPTGRGNMRFNALSSSYENIDCCSAYVPVNGIIEISFTDERSPHFRSVNVQVATCYFFTCAKGKDQLYKVAWGTSLS
jgi:hypothetical protein